MAISTPSATLPRWPCWSRAPTTNTVNGIPEDRRFTFVFEGRVQFLDHIVVSGDLRRRVAGVDSSKLDSDVPIPLFEEDPSTGWATSDHDPIVAYLED